MLAEWLISKFSDWFLREPPIAPSLMTDFQKIRFEIRPADVLLIEGYNRASRIIKQITQSTWTHSALYIGRLYDIDDIKLRSRVQTYYKGMPDEQLVVESLMGQGMVITPLSEYKNHNIRVCRPRGLSRSDAQKVIDYTIDRLGTEYSLRHVLDLARFMFPWGVLPRRWRSTLFVHNALRPTKQICSSIIASAFQSVHFPILPEIKRDKDGITLVSRNPKLYTPKDFDYSPFFDIIKYPILPLDGEGVYQRLPWELNAESGTEYVHLRNTSRSDARHEREKDNTPLLPNDTGDGEDDRNGEDKNTS
ncbi:MAG: hypothetical protein K0Q74_1334 [Gammaproteobacteria bacterium]|jgi:hypothetical protein|nr:hypothetical protein [Gammaproteobacteria bacterium]